METTRRESGRRRDTGFTLLEIMAVVLIMGMLIAVIGVNIKSQIDKARVQATRAQIVQLESALEFYRMDNGRYPNSSQGLSALVSKPSGSPEPRNYPPGGYIKKRDALMDAWGEEFQYESPGSHNQHGFDLWSMGADAATGGSESEADIGNWDSGPENGA